MAPFRLERYLRDLRDRTADTPDLPLELCDSPRVPRAMLRRIAHLWARALLDDRFETLLLPILVTAAPLVDALAAESRERGWDLPREFFAERLESGGCLLLIDGVAGVAEQFPRNVWFVAG
jgi:hypothetical protein